MTVGATTLASGVSAGLYGSTVVVGTEILLARPTRKKSIRKEEKTLVLEEDDSRMV